MTSQPVHSSTVGPPPVKTRLASFLNLWLHQGRAPAHITRYSPQLHAIWPSRPAFSVLPVAVLSRCPVSTPHLQSSPNSLLRLACLDVSSPDPVAGECGRWATNTSTFKLQTAAPVSTQTPQYIYIDHTTSDLIVTMASEEKGLTPTQPAISKSEGDVLPPSYDSHGSPTAPHHKSVADEIAQEPLMTRLGLTFDSFKPRAYGKGIVELDRSMKTRHLHMIAIGGSIGAGFFVGSGSALSTGGPGSLLIDFLIIGIMMFNVVYALGEMAVMYPVSGGFYTYSTRFIDPSWGFAMVSNTFGEEQSLGKSLTFTDVHPGLELRLSMGDRPPTRTHSLRSYRPILESQHLGGSLDLRFPRLHHNSQCVWHHWLRRRGVLVQLPQAGRHRHLHDYRPRVRSGRRAFIRQLQRVLGRAPVVRPGRLPERLSRLLLGLCHRCLCLQRYRACGSRRRGISKPGEESSWRHQASLLAYHSLLYPGIVLCRPAYRLD